MAESRSEGERIQQLEAQVTRLCRQIEHQQVGIVELRGSRATAAGRDGRAGRAHRTSRSASRRALLQWSGAAAAAAAVTLVASEQAAHAAPATPAADGGNLLIGNANLGTSQTSLAITGLSSASPFFQVNASGSTNPSAKAIAGISNASNGYGVYGSSTGASGFGVYGIGASGVGVYGTSTNNFGLEGQSTNSFGVYGTSTNADAIHGEATSGAGVSGFSETGVSLYAAGGVGTGGRIASLVYSSLGAPSTGTFSAGEQIRDSLGDLYICVVGGTPGTWKKVTAIPAGTLGGATVFLHAPFRLFDTRPGVSGCPIDPGVPMASGAVTTLQVTGTASTTDATLVVPSGATGIIGDLLAINVNGNGITGGFAGFLTLQPHSGSPTGNSYLHYYPATVQHNCVVMGLDASGKLGVGNYNTATNVGLDITGYII